VVASKVPETHVVHCPTLAVQALQLAIQAEHWVLDVDLSRKNFSSHPTLSATHCPPLRIFPSGHPIATVADEQTGIVVGQIVQTPATG